jgi:amino acid transporter
VAALGVALFPTEAPEGLHEASSWRPILGTMHLVCAVVLFSSFALFALWLFRLSDIPRWRDRGAEKKRRDVFFLVCGCVIVACMVWATFAGGTSILIPEMIAIMAFALAWLVKGEAKSSVVNGARRVARAVRP